MSSVMQQIILMACVAPFVTLCAVDRINVVKEKQILQTSEKVASKHVVKADGVEITNFKPFTGKILGSGVRMRLAPDVESPIVQEILKGELVIVSGEKNDFYAIDAPSDLK